MRSPPVPAVFLDKKRKRNRANKIYAVAENIPAEKSSMHEMLQKRRKYFNAENIKGGAIGCTALV